LSGAGIIFPFNSFRIITDLNYKGNILDYKYIDITPQKIKKDGFQIYSLKNSSVPFIAFAKEFNDKIYIIEFQGDMELDFKEEQILSTFKFTEKEEKLNWLPSNSFSFLVSSDKQKVVWTENKFEGNKMNSKLMLADLDG